MRAVWWRSCGGPDPVPGAAGDVPGDPVESDCRGRPGGSAENGRVEPADGWAGETDTAVDLGAEQVAGETVAGPARGRTQLQELGAVEDAGHPGLRDRGAKLCPGDPVVRHVELDVVAASAVVDIERDTDLFPGKVRKADPDRRVC